jgi:RimJ/RimL family protein N-acetyltransferase
MHDLPRNTPSLVLRHFVPGDAARIMALNAEASTRQWLPSHVYPTLDDATRAMAYLISCYATPGHPQQAPYVLAVDHQASGQLLGHVGFSPFGNEVEVSYAIAQASRGQGHGAEALAHACLWAAQTFDLSHVLALTASANGPSKRLLERTAFVQTEECVMMFQGHAQPVSRYVWTAPSARSLV